MDINIKMSDCKFYVDEQKRTVVCVIEDTHNKVQEFMANYIDWYISTAPKTITFVLSGSLEKKLILPDRFIGKAVCSEDDEWNEEVGRIIAFDRAKRKLNVSFFKRAQLFINEMENVFNNLVDDFNSYGERLDVGGKKRLEHIKKLCPTFTEK